ncbi:MAG: hypothetical protein KY475_26495 [Planctomycetes bacterium]|nr:hypothetical protein [Planctomycetota bacterium]
MNSHRLSLKTYEWADEMVRIGNRAVRRAQEESRRLGVPNVYSINGILYYELPNGELSRTDPYRNSPHGDADAADEVR